MLTYIFAWKFYFLLCSKALIFRIKLPLEKSFLQKFKKIFFGDAAAKFTPFKNRNQIFCGGVSKTFQSYTIILKLVYSNGIASQFGSTFGFVSMDIAICMLMNMIFCLLCCLAYRYSAAFPPTDEYFFAKMRNIKILLVLGYCFIIIPVWVFSLFSSVDPAILRAQRENEVIYHVYQQLRAAVKKHLFK